MRRAIDFVGIWRGAFYEVWVPVGFGGLDVPGHEYDTQGFEDTKAVVSIEDAFAVGTFWTEFVHEMRRGGDVDEILERGEADGKKLVVVEGTMRTGGQEHFYLEPNSTMAVRSSRPRS